MGRSVFENKEWEELSLKGQVIRCGFYHRYRNPDGSKNQAFDMFSGKILDVKDKKESGIQFFFRQLNEEICKDVTTSGASLEACKQILMEHGAKRVATLALGQSI
jgi:hypothetical protein